MIYLTLILGAMKSGKTTKLLNILSKYENIGKKCLFLNHIFDTRNKNDFVQTHSNHQKKCIKIKKLLNILTNKNFENSEVILIDESQFFDDLKEFILTIEKMDKKIYVAGLLSDYSRNNFGEIHKIFPLADNIIYLSGFCEICKNGNKSIFSKRICTNNKKILINDSFYKSVCRNCYLLK